MYPRRIMSELQRQQIVWALSHLPSLVARPIDDATGTPARPVERLSVPAETLVLTGQFLQDEPIPDMRHTHRKPTPTDGLRSMANRSRKRR